MNTSQDNLQVFDASECSELEESLRKLSSISEEQFATIKDEKWYRRLWDMVTFSKKGEIRLCDQISTLAQAQQIVAQFLLKESQQNKAISDLVNNNATYIKKLAGQSVSFKSKLTSINNLMLLLNEINNGLYGGYRPITTMCVILSQLDADVLADKRAINNILLSLNNHNVLNGKNIDVIDFLLDSAFMTEEEVPLVYAELSTISDNYYAGLVISLIEELYFGQNGPLNKDDAVLSVAIANSVEKKYDSTTLNTIFISLLNSIIAGQSFERAFSITNPSAKHEREEAEKMFYAGKLIDAYPKFIRAADLGDARACYFAALYYKNAFGSTAENEELYKKYIDFGISRDDTFCKFEYSRYLYRQGNKSKSVYWRNKTLQKIGKLAEKGDAVACELIASVSGDYYFEMYSSYKGKYEELSENDTRAMLAAPEIYKKYSAKAVDAGYWPAAFSKCFALEMAFDSISQEKLIEKYGWMFENVEWAKIQEMLGFYYLMLDTTENRYYKRSAAYFLKAYELQKTSSLCGFISFFLKADIISESQESGIRKKDVDILYYKGLDSDDPSGLAELGKLYLLGVGESHSGRNTISAFEHYERAYEKFDLTQDSPRMKEFCREKESTAYVLGYMLQNGIGTERNDERAVQYYEYAAQNGEKRAIKALANCYLNGLGVPKDLTKYNELLATIKDE